MNCNCCIASSAPVIKQGDAYDLALTLTFNEESITEDELDLLEEIELDIGYLNPVTYDPHEVYDATVDAFLIPLTQEQTLALEDGVTLVDCRVQFINGDVVGVVTPARIFVREAMSNEVI